jgi:hypothetical protein
MVGPASRGREYFLIRQGTPPRYPQLLLVVQLIERYLNLNCSKEQLIKSELSS